MGQILTHEDFAHICLKIRDGDTDTQIPCCGNCKYYKEFTVVCEFDCGYRCFHPRLQFIGNLGYLVMQPEDFCSRYEERENG